MGQDDHNTPDPEIDSDLKKIRDYAEQQHDKLVVYISSGALFLSIAFVDDIVTISTSSFIWLLFLTWGFFTLTLIINLYSHRTAKEAVDHLIKDEVENALKMHKWTNRFNNWTEPLILLGVISFILFVSLNL